MIGYLKESAWATRRSVPALVRGLMAALVAGLLALAGCATPGGPGASGADAGTVMKAYGDYKAAWERRDVAAIVGSYHQNGSLDNPAAGGAVSGPAFAGWLQGLFAAIPDFRVEVVSAGMVGDQRVADQWVIKGTWTKPFPGGPLAGAQPTGKSFTVPGASFYEWKGGKIVTGVQYFDQMAFLTQIGVIGQK